MKTKMPKAPATVLLVLLVAVSCGTAQAQVTSRAVEGPPVTGVGLPLPLAADQIYVPFADGCGAVLLASSSREVIDLYRSYSWVGGCRFGVAHGRGFTIRAQSSGKDDQTFHYGHLIDFEFAGFDGLMSWDTAVAPGNEVPNEVLMANAEPIGKGSVSQTTQVLFQYSERGTHYEHTIRFSEMKPPCYFGRVNLPRGWKLIGDLQPLQDLCRANAGQINVPGSLLGFWHDISTAPVATMRSRDLLVSSQKKVQENFHLCTSLPGDCEQRFRELLAPLMPRIVATKETAEAMQAEGKAQAERNKAELKKRLDERFEPLEARRSALMKQFAKDGQ